MRPRVLAGLNAAALLLGAQAISAQTPVAMTGDEVMAALENLSFSAQDPNFLSIQGIGGARTVSSGTLFLSISGSDTRPTGVREFDGSLSFGAGFGNQETSIGGEVAVEVTSAEPDDFGDSGYLNAKVGGRVLRSLGQNYLAVGAEGMAPWGDARGQEVNLTLTGTRVTRLGPFANGRFYPVILTLGYGDHQDHSVDPGLFAGIGVGLTPNLSVSLANDAGILEAGFGLHFERVSNAVFMFTAHDLAQTEGDTRLSVAVGISTDKLFGNDRP